MIEQRLKELGIRLAEPAAPAGSYAPAVEAGSGKFVFVSGQLPVRDGELVLRGKVGAELTVERGREAAELAALNCLSAVSHALGGLDRLKRILRVTGYVASAPGFREQHKVVDGASEFFSRVFPEGGAHSRVAVGVLELPLGSPVEIEIVAEVSPEGVSF